uniref:Uncharacterized protein n=1 Tax=Sphaerodactylus townsendi TaxID=933632 RepID=A0ACB8E4U0_9SAUR
MPKERPRLEQVCGSADPWGALLCKTLADRLLILIGLEQEPLPDWLCPVSVGDGMVWGGEGCICLRVQAETKGLLGRSMLHSADLPGETSCLGETGSTPGLSPRFPEQPYLFFPA